MCSSCVNSESPMSAAAASLSDFDPRSGKSVHIQEIDRIAISRLDSQLTPTPGGFCAVQRSSCPTASVA
jgi:hypothetical protein